MIAFAGAMRLQAGSVARDAGPVSVRPRWPLQALAKA
jgi:tRNA A37 threonylcarbamoyltransferase TsaD